MQLAGRKTHGQSAGLIKAPPRAFTLIELLVVISIIGILVALVLPAMGRARARAHRAACVANQRQWGTCFSMYSDDYNGTLYHKVGSVDWDDIDSPNLHYIGGGERKHRMRTMRICPAIRAKMHPKQIDLSAFHSYSLPIGQWLSKDEYQDANEPGSPFFDGKYYWPNIKSLRNPAEFLLLIDSHGHDITCSSFTDAVTVGDPKPDKDPMPAIERHQGGVNALFADNHVEFFTLDRIIEQDALPCDLGNPWLMMQ